jgi:hypothetical protein
MRRADLQGITGRRQWKRIRSDNIATDRVERDFARSGPNQLWVTDIPEHPTREGKVYCCVVLDTYSRVVGWSIDVSPNAALVTHALGMAIEARLGKSAEPGTIIHSDSKTGELPLRARCTTRLRTALLTAVIDQGQPVAQVAQDHQVAWWTAQRCVNAAAVVLPDVDRLHVTQLGIDEHRYRRVRWFRDPDQGGWRRVEPWMTTLVNVASGQVLGVVDGRDSAAVQAWLGHRSQAWRDRIQIVAIDPSAAFRKAITTTLPAARIAVDPFHLAQLANLCLTRVRQRLVQEHQQRRGRKIDPSWAHRTLLLRG